MSEHFHDDNFIEAAKAYQSIKAPSALRERVLAGVVASSAEQAPLQSMQGAPLQSGQGAPLVGHMPSAVSLSDAERVHVHVRRKGLHGKIYRFASLAACLAIMVVSLPHMLPSEPAEDVLAGQEDVLEQSVNHGQSANHAIRAVEPPPESTGPNLQEGDVEPAGIPEGDSTGELKKDLVANPGAQADDTVSGEEMPQPYGLNTAEVSASEKAGAEGFAGRDGREPGSEDGQVKAGEPAKEPVKEPAATSAVQVSRLIPALAAGNEVLEDMAVRLVEGEEGTCTVEVTSGEKTALVTMSKNVESGQWEVVPKGTD